MSFQILNPTVNTSQLEGTLINGTTDKIYDSLLPASVYENVISVPDDVARDTLIPTLNEGDVVRTTDNNKVYVWDGSAFILTGGVAGAVSLATLSDVQLTSLQENNALMYNSATLKWNNRRVTIDPNDINGFFVDTLANGQVLRYNSGTQYITNATLSHNDLSNIGTNTHTQIDTHINSNIAHNVDGIVGLNETQTLTNKTLDDTTNIITCDKLRTLTGVVTISGSAAPTAGQILTASSGTAATWQSPSGSSPLTTKGDIYIYSNTNARLPIGTNNQFLIADSTQATGIKWANAIDSTFMIYDDADSSKAIKFELSTLSTATTRTLSVPDANITIVGVDNTTPLLNKTLDDVSNTITCDKLRTATTTVNISSASAPSSGQVLTASSGTLATWQTPTTNFNATSFYIFDNSDNSKVLKFLLSDMDTTTTLFLRVDNRSNNSKIVTEASGCTKLQTNNTLAPITINNAPPTAGQVLTATSSTNATWQNPGAASIGVQDLNNVTISSLAANDNLSYVYNNYFWENGNVYQYDPKTNTNTFKYTQNTFTYAGLLTILFLPYPYAYNLVFTTSAIYKSTDGFQTVSTLTTNLYTLNGGNIGVAGGSNIYYDAALLVGSDLYLVNRTNSKIYKSIDQGITWTLSYTGTGGLTSLVYVNSFIVAWSDTTNNIAFSSNNGTSWATNTSLGFIPYQVTADTINNRIWFCYFGTLKWSSNMTSFTTVTPTTITGAVTWVYAYPPTGTYYVGTQSAFFYRASTPLLNDCVLIGQGTNTGFGYDRPIPLLSDSSKLWFMPYANDQTTNIRVLDTKNNTLLSYTSSTTLLKYISGKPSWQNTQALAPTNPYFQTILTSMSTNPASPVANAVLTSATYLTLFTYTIPLAGTYFLNVTLNGLMQGPTSNINQISLYNSTTAIEYKTQVNEHGVNSRQSYNMSITRQLNTGDVILVRVREQSSGSTTAIYYGTDAAPAGTGSTFEITRLFIT